MINIDNRYYINEVSKLSGVSTRTLRYYNDINLFNPTGVDEKSGYRYYSVEKFEELNFIMFLRYLNVSISEIKEYMTDKKVDKFEEILMMHIEGTDKKIKELNTLSKMMKKNLEDIKFVKSIKKFGEISINTYPNRKVKKFVYPKNKTNNEDDEFNKFAVLKGSKDKIIGGYIGIIMSMESFNKGIFNDYKAVVKFIEEDGQDEESIYIIPEGKFITSYYKGTNDKASEYYQKIYDYIKNHNYEVKGNIIERKIVHNHLVDSPEDYITEIQVPIK